MALGGLAAVVLAARGGDVSNPDVEFVETEEATAPAPEPAPEPTPRARHPADDGFAWPTYGFTDRRPHHLPLRRPLRPPFRQAWVVRGKVLLEFTPVLCRRRLFLLRDNGVLLAVSRLSGKVVWRRKIGSLAAASPACGRGTVYAVALRRDRRSAGGRVVALTERTGRVRWSRDLASRAESSPLLVDGHVYFGSENGTVYAMRARDGDVR